MTLRDWLKINWLKEEPSSKEEIRDLFSIVDRCLEDSNVTEISADLRLQSAFNATLVCANIALRAAGYKMTSDAGHHYKTIQSLSFTIKADQKLIRLIESFRRKRITVTYDTAGAATEVEVEALLGIAGDLRKRVNDWIKIQHPELS